MISGRNFRGKRDAMSKKPTPDELLVAIHRHCLACSGGSRKEVRRCKLTACELWPWREPEGEGKPKRDKRQMSMFDLMKEARERAEG